MRQDDWITKLYITEILTNQMKYTDQGLIKTIKTEPIHYVWFDGESITSQSVQFEMEFLHIKDKITISEKEPQGWLFDLLYDKILTAPENNTDKLVGLRPYDPDPIVFVERFGNEYLLETLYNILSDLLDNGNKLISIKLI